MNRIADVLQDKSRKKLVTYSMAGDPSISFTLSLMKDFVGAGASIIELGFPFSDPMAEGPVIQAANERALANGVNLFTTLEIIRKFREFDQRTPIVIMGYLNPVEQYGIETLSRDLRQAGGDGMIVVDCPFEESSAYAGILINHGLAPIFLISPTTTEERVKQIATLGKGFVYYVSLKGITGAGNIDLPSIKNKLQQISKYIKLPIMVGFGINTPNMARCIASLPEVSGIVIGSHLIQSLVMGKKLYDEVKNFSSVLS